MSALLMRSSFVTVMVAAVLVHDAALAAPTGAGVGPQDAIKVAVSLDRAQPKVGEIFTFRVALENLTNRRMLDVRLDVLPVPHVRQQMPDEWIRLDSSEDAYAWSVVPGGEALIVVRLVGLAPTRKLILGALVRWRDSQLASESAAFVAFPEVTVERRWSWAQILSVAVPFFGTLAVAFFGWFFNTLLQRRRERLDTFLRMHRRVLELAERHYMPIGSAVGSLKERVRRLNLANQSGAKTRDRAFGEVFAALVLLMRRDLDLTHQVGGWILLDRDGEKLVSNLWERFRGEALDHLESFEIGRLSEELGASPTLSGLLHDFERRVAPVAAQPRQPVDRLRRLSALPAGRLLEERESSLAAAPAQRTIERWQKLRSALDKWLADSRESFERSLAHLDQFMLVLQIELNRIHGPLYFGLITDRQLGMRESGMLADLEAGTKKRRGVRVTRPTAPAPSDEEKDPDGALREQIIAYCRKQRPPWQRYTGRDIKSFLTKLFDRKVKPPQAL